MTKRVSSLPRAKEIAAHTLLWSTRINKLYAGFYDVLQGIGPIRMTSPRKRS